MKRVDLRIFFLKCKNSIFSCLKLKSELNTKFYYYLKNVL